MNRRGFFTLFGLLSLAIAGLLWGAAAYSVNHVRQYEARLEAAWSRQSHDALWTFARLSRRSLIRGDRDALEAMALLMTDVRAFFVQIVVGDEEILLVTRETGVPDFAPLPWMRFGADGIATVTSDQAIHDVAVAIESADGEARTVGYTRIGFDRAPVASVVQARARALTAANLGLACALVGAFALIIWRQRRRIARTASTEKSEDAPPLRIDEATKRVWIHGEPVRLTPKQFAMLSILASQPGRVYADDELVEAIWPNSPYASSSDVKQCIYTLRKRLGTVCEDPAYVIVNVQGYGYKLSMPAFERVLRTS